MQTNCIIISVMQSDGNVICVEVVLVSFNKASRDENNILDQMHKSKYVRIFIMMILIFLNIFSKKHNKLTVPLKPNFMNST